MPKDRDASNHETGDNALFGLFHGQQLIGIARAKGLLDESVPLARMRPVLAVRHGNPKGIHSLADVLDKPIRVVQAKPEAAAVGKLAAEALKKSGHWARFPVV